VEKLREEMKASIEVVRLRNQDFLFHKANQD